MQSIDISTGTIAEQLIACAILANIELQQEHIDSARRFLKDALDIARRLEKHGPLYQAAEISKFVHFTYDIQGTQEILLLPIISKNLILPAINLQEMVNRMKPAIPKVVQLQDVTIVYFRLCLQTEKLIAILHHTKNVRTSAELIEATSTILEDSLPHEFHLSDFLSMAEDYFMLARNMLVKGNASLTLIALRNANKMLAAYGATEPAGTQLERIAKLKTELAAISKAIP